jgi:hypothetical protein
MTMPRKSLPRIASVAAGAEPLTLQVCWDTGEQSRMDVSGLVDAFRVYAPLRQDEALFQRVRVGEYGTDVAWEDGLDMSADSLWRLARSSRARR